MSLSFFHLCCCWCCSQSIHSRAVAWNKKKRIKSAAALIMKENIVDYLAIFLAIIMQYIHICYSIRGTIPIKKKYTQKDTLKYGPNPNLHDFRSKSTVSFRNFLESIMRKKEAEKITKKRFRDCSWFLSAFSQ